MQPAHPFDLFHGFCCCVGWRREKKPCGLCTSSVYHPVQFQAIIITLCGCITSRARRGLTQTVRPLHPHWGLLTSGVQNKAVLPSAGLILPLLLLPTSYQRLLGSSSFLLCSNISPLRFSRYLLSHLGLSHCEADVLTSSRRAWPPVSSPSANHYLSKCVVSVWWFYCPCSDVSQACGYKYQCVMFDIYDPTSGCIPQSSQWETQLRNTIPGRHLKLLNVLLCFSCSTDVSTATTLPPTGVGGTH